MKAIFAPFVAAYHMAAGFGLIAWFVFTVTAGALAVLIGGAAIYAAWVSGEPFYLAGAPAAAMAFKLNAIQAEFVADWLNK